MVTPSQRLSQVRDTVTSLRELDGPDLHTPVVMAVRGPKAKRWRPTWRIRSRSPRFRATLGPR